jgi:serine/threonine protein kinase
MYALSLTQGIALHHPIVTLVQSQCVQWRKHYTIKELTVTRPAGVEQSEITDESAIKALLDTLANGACDESAFLLSVQERFKSDPEGNWEVLSQLDQYYRRGRIKTEVFLTVKNALAESALGARDIPVIRDTPVAHDIPVTRDISVTRDIPVTRQIPVARDAVVPQVTHAELSDTHTHREHTPPLDAAGDIRPGSVLRRRYRIESILGHGAMSSVFQALDEYRLETPLAGQRVAIKVLHSAVTKHAELLTELRLEFQQLQLLSHPNIVRAFEFDRDGPLVFLTMELLSGVPLSRVLQSRKSIPLERTHALAVIRDVGAAIAHAHARGVMHGAVNPQNIFITLPGEIRVLGFGARRGSNRSSTMPDHELTLPSATSGYASCQVLEGERADARDDVFALACIAYILLCGKHPFAKKTAIEAREAGVRLRRPSNLTNQQWRALRAGLRWEHEDRPADLQLWLQRMGLRRAAKHLAPMAELLAPPPPKEPKSAFALAAVMAVALLLAGGYWLISRPGVSHRADSSAPILSTNGPSPNSTVPSVAATRADTTSPLPSAAPPSAATPVAAPSPAAASPSPAAARPSAATPTAAPSAPTPSGPSKVELATDTVDVPAGEPSAQVPVRRKGSLRGETNFTWWTESGTAKPGVDFSAALPQLAYIGDGKTSISLSIPLRGTRRTQSKSFYVVIDQTEGGALLGARTLTMVTLLPSD